MKRIIKLMTFCALLASCSKENTTTPSNPNPTPEKTPLELLKGTWKIESSISNEAGNPSTLPDCSKDNLVTFNADGTMLADEGAVKCDSMDAQTSTGTWKMANYPTLEFKQDATTEFTVVKVIQLDETYLKYEMPVDTRIYTLTWKRK